MYSQDYTDSFIIENATKEGLKSIGFVYSGMHESDTILNYKIKFYSNINIVVSVFAPSGKVEVNMYQDGEFYAPFYGEDKVHKKLIKRANQVIDMTFHRLGIERIKND